MIIKSKDNQRFDLIFDDIGNILFKIKEKKSSLDRDYEYYRAY